MPPRRCRPPGRSAKAARAEVGAARLEDRIQQNQSPDFLDTVRDSVSAQADWRASPRHELSAGAMLVDERASSESYGEKMRTDTDQLSLFVQDSIEAGRHARWRHSATRTTKPRATP